MVRRRLLHRGVLRLRSRVLHSMSVNRNVTVPLGRKRSARGVGMSSYYGRTSSMILPMCALDSINLCAAAASASGNTR